MAADSIADESPYYRSCSDEESDDKSGYFFVWGTLSNRGVDNDIDNRYHSK
ncbi:hypothetical protein [Paenibacillus kobensis]|uniref:hypothetical protein n=1 Tax=Paenibacillus kobensis TaxID=59841 RepID=UPI0013E314C2|nr:hypothetical protein [Paenibacillus kobensis]